MQDSNRLTVLEVTRKKKPGRYGDGNGLWLQVTPAGTKSWLFRYMINGKARQMGLGPVRDVSLAEARGKASDSRRLLLSGIDPIEVRQEEKTHARIEAASKLTFETCAEKYITAHEPSWKNPKHRQQWRNTLKNYAYPVLGDLPISAVDTTLVLQVLEPIWTIKSETAARIRGRIESIIDWATARGYRQGENPARWRGHLDKLLPARSKIARVRHHPALPFSSIPEFLTKLRKLEGVSPRALEFCILTAARTGEVINAKRDEFDLVERVWKVPPERMKSGREHRVPLSDAAIEIIKALPIEAKSEYVFPGNRSKMPLSQMALLKVLRGMEFGNITTHGFRSTFRDWAAETTSFPSEVVEMALAHVISDKTEAAYRRGDLFVKRQLLMSEWSKYCSRVPSEQQVVRLQGRKRA